jgi:hypothetical protein
MALTVSVHAEHRWFERFGGDLFKSLRRAIPFGAQRGDARYLKDGDAVFVVNNNVVTTVLTHHQAIANMQRAGIRMRTADLIPAQVSMSSKAAKELKRQKKNPHMNSTELAIHAFLERVMACDDDDLAKLFMESRFTSFIGMLIKLRNKVRNVNAAVVRATKERAIALRTVKDICGDEVWQRVVDEVNKHQELMRKCDVPNQ